MKNSTGSLKLRLSGCKRRNYKVEERSNPVCENAVPLLTVIVPIYNEEKYIACCLDSILAQDYPKDCLEIFLVDGMSTDATRRILEPYLRKYSMIHLLDNPKRIAPCAMNLGIAHAHGDVLLRLDAHALYADNYFRVLTQKLRELCADNVGSPWYTDVLNKTPKTLAIREVLSHPFGVGNSTFRTGANQVMEVDTVPFGCWPKEVFQKYGLYDERLVRNQDIELNKRILRGGGHIYLVPDTYCTYLARETYMAIARNNYGNGKWNILTVYYTKRFSSLSLRHFVPMSFVLSLVIPPFLALWWSPFLWLTVMSVVLYLLSLSVVSVSLSCSRRLNAFYLMWTFVLLHFSYGWGSLIGILTCMRDGLFKRKNQLGHVS